MDGSPDTLMLILGALGALAAMLFGGSRALRGRGGNAAAEAAAAGEAEHHARAVEDEAEAVTDAAADLRADREAVAEVAAERDADTRSQGVADLLNRPDR